MTKAIIVALFLNFAGVSGTIIRQAGYHNISRISQLLCIPLILGGIVACFLAAYSLVTTEGWLAGLVIWIISGVVLAGVARTISARWDGVLSILATASLVVGVYFFWIRFI